MPISPDLGKNPLSSSAASNENMKASPQYESMSTEIAKLSSIQDAGSVRWDTVIEAAQQILTEQVKDIPTAAYLSIALAEKEGIMGWQLGGQILTDILEHWWEDALPPLKRIRARVNALDWWHDRSKAFLAREHAPITMEEQEKLLAFIKTMDALLGDKLPDCQSLHDIRESAQHIEVIANTETKEEETQKEPADSPLQQEVSAPVQQASLPPTAPVTPPTPAPSIVLEKAPQLDAQDPELLKKSQQALVHMARQHYDVTFATACPHETLAWESLYISLWASIEQLPPSEGKTTLVPAPDRTRLVAMQTLLQAQKFEQAAKTAAFFAPTSLFCLDVHYTLFLAIQGLIKAGQEHFVPALTTIEHHVRLFITRFQGVETLQFSDESPFADAACKAWLRSLQNNEGTAAPTNSPQQALDDILAKATQLRIEKQLSKALAILNEAMHQASPPTHVRLQIAQVQLLTQEQHFEMAVALADNIVQTLDTHALDKWDASLSEEALRTVYFAYKGYANAGQKSALIAQRLAILNPAAALELL